MGLDDLLTAMEARGNNTSNTPSTPDEVSPNPASILGCTPNTSDTPRSRNAKKAVHEARTMDTTTVSRWWRFQYAVNAPWEVSYCSPVTHAIAMSGEPDAISAEAFEPIRRPPDTPLSGDDHDLIRLWLARIGETDEDSIACVLHQCRTDADAREYFLKFASANEIIGITNSE